jgi:hypothetical protein
MRIIASTACATVDITQGNSKAHVFVITLQPKSHMSRSIHHSPPTLQFGQTDRLLRQIVEASMPAARRRINADTTAMSAGELRGYLRARAIFAVRDQTSRTIAAHLLDNWLAEPLVEQALDRTVNLLFRELAEHRPLVIPLYEAPMRAAA